MGSQELTVRNKVVFRGETYHLPIVSKGRNLTDDEKEEIAELVCLMYSTDEYPLLACLKHCGVGSENTWSDWRRSNEQIGELYTNAQKLKHTRYIGSLRERARTSLEKAIDGYKITLEERIGKPYKDKDGKTHIETIGIKEKEIYIRPSVRALEMVLFNLEGTTFAKSPEPYREGDDVMPQKVEFEIIGSTEPVTDEDDIKEIEDGGK